MLSALRGPFLDARRTLSFASSATVLAFLGLTRRGPVWWPARGLVRLAYAQQYAQPAKRRHVGPLITAVSKYENVIIRYPMAVKSTDWPSGGTSAGGLAFCYARNAKGLREPERKRYLTPVELN